MTNRAIKRLLFAFFVFIGVGGCNLSVEDDYKQACGNVLVAEQGLSQKDVEKMMEQAVVDDPNDDQAVTVKLFKNNEHGGVFYQCLSSDKGKSFKAYITGGSS